MNEQYEEAEKYFSLAQRIALNAMPLIMVTINRACLSLALGNQSQALKMSMEIMDKVKQHKVFSLKRKYFTNVLMIQYAAGLDSLTSFINNYLELISKYVDGDIIGMYRDFINDNHRFENMKLHNLYFPAGLAYWYIDPLKLV
jgi:hypothetical protein